MSYAPDDSTKWQAKYYSNPPGAEIYVDGVYVGTAPLAYSYSSVGMSAKEVAAKFPTISEQSVTSGYYTFEIFFDFINSKAIIKEYPSALSLFAETREISFEKSTHLTPEMIQNALNGLEEMRATLPADINILPERKLLPPNIIIGPVIELLGVKTGSERVKVIHDLKGQALVFISSRKLRQVLEVIVNQDGVIKSRVIRSGDTPESLDLAYDAQGKLHLMLNLEHFILDDDVWRTSDQTPWQESGTKVWNVHFVPGAPDLTWAFQVNGDELNAPTRIEIYGFGGFGAGIIWPWFTHGSRIVIVSQAPGEYSPWVVLEPQGKEDTYATSIASDLDANIYVLYEKSRGGIGAESKYYYIRIDSKVFKSSKASLPGIMEIQVGSRKIRAVGENKARPIKQCLEIGKQIAVDPQSGTALIGNSFLVRENTWNSISSCSAVPAQVVPSGLNSFHALALGKPRDSWWGKGHPVQYLLFSEGAWSTPVELGLADVESFWGNVATAIGITTIGHDKVFLVWPMEHGIVGRWIQRIN